MVEILAARSPLRGALGISGGARDCSYFWERESGRISLSTKSYSSRWSMRVRLAVSAFAALAATLGLVAPASAIIVRLKHGHYLSYMPLTRRPSGVAPNTAAPSTRPQGSSLSCANCDSINHGLDYGGGPVMTSNTNYVIAWIPHTTTHTYSGNPFQDSGYDPNLTCVSGDACGYMDGVAQFFIDLAHDSGGTANSDSVATQYNQANPNANAAYNSHFGACPGTNGCGPNGVFLDTDAIPGNASGCPETATSANGGDAKGSGGFCITDAQIQTELNSYLSSHGLPRGGSNEYFLLTPPDVVTCEDAAGQHCSGNAPSGHAEFCGYHSFGGPASNGFLYANIPDSSGTTTSSFNDGIVGCDPFSTAGDCAPGGFVCNYNYNWAEGSLSAVSHEHIESVTDPQPPSGWNDDEPNSPYQGGQEIGDLCNGDQADDNNTNYQFDSNTFTETPYNYTINGHHYWLQMEYSNQGTACMHSLSPDPPPGASFIVARQNGTHVTFNASPSCGNASCAFPISEFVWQMDDFVQKGVTPGGPEGLVHTVTCPFSHSNGDPAGCDGEFFTHTFPEPGIYDVAMTTQTADGRSWGTERQVRVYAAPAPHISASTPRLAGLRISFRSRTTHDPSLSIRSYSWKFGDGGTSSAANPSHTFARAGTYRVILTVTDTRGQTGSAAQTLKVAGSCKVPNVKGKPLGKAESAIKAAGCNVGSVKKPSRKSGSELVVKSQSPGGGSVVPKGTKVSLTTVWK